MHNTFSEALIEQLPIGILWRYLEPDTASQRVYCNPAAQRLLKLNKRDISMPEIAALALTLDTELSIKKTSEALLPNPIQQALDGELIDRRDLLFGQLPLHLKSLRFSVNQQQVCAALIQPRDHRLFIESAETGDMSGIELSLRDTLAFDKLISELSSRLINAEGSQIDQHIEAALAAMGQFGLADRCYVFQFNATLDQIHNSHEWVREGVSAHLDELQHIAQEDLPWFFANMREEGLMVVHDVATLSAEASNERELFDSEDIRSIVCVAMQAGGQLIGFVGCDMVARQRHWSEADIRRLKLVGEIIAQALQSQQYLKALSATQRQLIEANQRLHQLVGEDSLTGLANRRQFDHELDTEMRRSMRQQQPLSLMMIDVDHFKSFNDTYGHLNGDDALRTVANLLHSHFKRSGELVCRFGGEEFAVLLPGANKSQAVESGGHLLEKMAQLGIHHAAAESGLLSLSIGIACAPEDCGDDPSASAAILANNLLQQADQALYQAKKEGRNCVISTLLQPSQALYDSDE
ncbi:sensor domain-containing diguanylate cyclase [Aliidiomarina sedimenti]|uniref:diguanylate cyclase n=1 Tax=Aliidiomarina sedimenti TaxID=1933879 RepID=A0ABY0C2V7_9GAMM|nr:sensor domain-containing diguanylate cyclase [Aliidiomarina sedimenti]RUO32205.1 sensor domain-containing diguanylate cyclase [Aliidiomarina sedimenti]